MKGGTRPLGYTIVEVMIVLAVSGVMFVIAATFIGGKQAKTAFTSGSNEFTTQVQTIISDVINGQYSDVNFGCTVTGAGAAVNIDPSGTHGLNAPCVFIGKVIQPIYKGNTSQFAVFSMAGARTNTSYNVTTPIKKGSLDLTVYSNVPQNLDVTKITVIDAGGASHTDTTGALGVGFAQSLGTTSLGTDNGAQTVNLFYTQTSAADPLAEGSTVALLPASSATLCLSDGTRFATLLLGSSTTNGSQLSATLQVVGACP